MPLGLALLLERSPFQSGAESKLQSLPTLLESTKRFDGARCPFYSTSPTLQGPSSDSYRLRSSLSIECELDGLGSQGVFCSLFGCSCTGWCTCSERLPPLILRECAWIVRGLHSWWFLCCTRLYWPATLYWFGTRPRRTSYRGLSTDWRTSLCRCCFGNLTSRGRFFSVWSFCQDYSCLLISKMLWI